MAISKTQNERPAITSLIDVVNGQTDTLAIHQQSLNTVAEGLGDEISAREQADSALSDRIDATNSSLSNRIDTEVRERTGAVQGVQSQIGDGFQDTTVTSVFGALSSAVNSISSEIGDGFSQDETVAGAVESLGNSILTLAEWQARFRLGLTESFEVAAGESQSSSIAFNTPFADTAEVAVYLVCVDGAEVLTNLECKLISATYSGFSWSVSNSGDDSATIKVGFLAVRLN